MDEKQVVTEALLVYNKTIEVHSKINILKNLTKTDRDKVLEEVKDTSIKGLRTFYAVLHRVNPDANLLWLNQMIENIQNLK